MNLSISKEPAGENARGFSSVEFCEDLALPSAERERFHLTGSIGLGGAGCVYKAWDDVLGKFVALKMVQLAGPAAEIQLRREAAVAQSLTHPSIVRIHDVVTFRGKTCISMEYVNGTDLAAYLSERGKVDVANVVWIARQVCSGLEAAHKAGIIHCDLKPANIMLEEGRVRIVDFGLAVELGTPATERAWTGTPVYMSPEQKQRLPVDRRTDFYSLGLVLFELLSGRRPSVSELEQVTPRALHKALGQTPRWMRAIISKCLQCRPEDRYASAAEIAADLRRFSGSSSQRGNDGVNKRAHGLFRMSSCAALSFLLIAGGYSGHVISAAAHSHTGSPDFKTIALFHIKPQNSSSEAVGDGMDDYLRDALEQSPGFRIWRPNPYSEITPGSAVVTKADLIITGSIDQVGNYATVRLYGMKGDSHRVVFSLAAGASTPFELQQKLLSELVSKLPFASSREIVGARDSTSANLQSYSLYLRANHIIRNQPTSKEALRQAVDLLNRAIASGPSCALCFTRKADAELMLCDLNHDEKWMRDVLTDVQQAREIDENSEAVVSTAAQVYSRTDRRKEAIMLLESAKKLHPSSARIRHLLGTVLAEEGLYPDALAELKEAVALDPIDVAHLNTLGVIELQVPDYAVAINAFSKILEIDPGNPAALVNLAGTYLRAARFEEAIRPAEKALQRDASAANYTNLAIANFYVGKQQLSLLLFQQAAKLEPTSEVYVGNLAHAYRWMHMKQHAEPTYRRAIDLALQEIHTRPSSEVLANAGLYYAALGKPEAANSYMGQARAKNPSDLDVMYKEAVAAELLGTPSRALDLLRKVCARGYPMALAANNPDLAQMRQLPNFRTLP